MFKELFSDTCWKMSVLATAAVGTTTTFALNHINLVCTILVSITAASYTIVKIYQEIRRDKTLLESSEYMIVSEDLKKQCAELRELLEKARHEKRKNK